MPKVHDGSTNASPRQLDDRLMMARCANNLGNVEFYRSMFPASLALYKQATSLFEQVGSLHGVAEAYHNQGVVLREMEELEAARAATERAVETAQILGDARAIGWTLGAQGETDASRGDRQSAMADQARCNLDVTCHRDRAGATINRDA